MSHTPSSDVVADGRPRIDYSPQDDEFLCRYLAKHHTSGSWSSRKTYETMVGPVFH